jgi:hypothetical protein
LYKTSVEYGIRLVPEPEFAELATPFRANAVRNLHLTGELIPLTKAFGAADILVLLHKGPVLAQAAYGDLALREFTDLDLLIHADDLPRAIALRSEHGYHAPDELAWLSPSAPPARHLSRSSLEAHANALHDSARSRNSVALSHLNHARRIANPHGCAEALLVSEPIRVASGRECL